MHEELSEYRKHLIGAEQKAQEDFDKAVLSLSGGALGISFAFIKDIVGVGSINNPGLLLFSWGCWGSSIIAILASYFFSHLSLRKAINQVDSDEIYKGHPGGAFDWITAFLNACGGILFFVGVILMIVFVAFNLI